MLLLCLTFSNGWEVWEEPFQGQFTFRNSISVSAGLSQSWIQSLISVFLTLYVTKTFDQFEMEFSNVDMESCWWVSNSPLFETNLRTLTVTVTVYEFYIQRHHKDKLKIRIIPCLIPVSCSIETHIQHQVRSPPNQYISVCANIGTCFDESYLSN